MTAALAAVTRKFEVSTMNGHGTCLTILYVGSDPVERDVAIDRGIRAARSSDNSVRMVEVLTITQTPDGRTVTANILKG